MLDAYLTRVIRSDNPWIGGDSVQAWYRQHLPQPYIERHARLAPDHRACLVAGPRQAGKSTLIWKHLADSEAPCLYLNCEEPAVQQWLDSPATFLADLAQLVEGPPVPLLFEEIQHLDNAGLLLKGIVDRRYPAAVFATGSAAFDLGDRVRESLAGRAVRQLLLPFSLAEVSAELRGPAALVADETRQLFRRMLRFGGYPTVHMAADPERELAILVESFIVRDASDRSKIRLPAAFRKVLELAASQIGNLCKFSAWAEVASVSNDTVAGYISLMEESHVVRLVRPFVGGKRAELTATPKIYFVDNGVRNLLFGGFADPADRADGGALVENFALSEILKSTNPLLDTVRFWRTKAGAEVDFIVEHQGRRLACEVKAGRTGPRLARPARSFIDAYAPERFLQVGDDQHPDQQLSTTRVQFIRMPDLAAEVTDFVSS